MSFGSSHRDGTHSNKVSEVFNQGAGDFALISSDETIFYVPRAVLQLSSKVFETMFEAGTPSAEDRNPIRMQADEKHLEIILKYAHPGYVSPSIQDVESLAELLRIAKQYEMNAVTDHLRVWFTNVSLDNGVYSEPITARQPLTAFLVAFSFDFVLEARYALREVIKCDLNHELGISKGHEIPSSCMQYILQLRTKRTAWLITQAEVFSRGLTKACEKVISGAKNAVTVKKFSSIVSDCLKWESRAIKKLEARPTFLNLKNLIMDGDESFIALVKDDEDLTKIWSVVTRLEVKAARLESELPELGDIVA